MAIGIIALVIAVAAGVGYGLSRSSGSPALSARIRPPGIPASISTSLANRMALNALNAPAPGFTLTDQAGKTMSLSAFRGKVVVLEFMDSHCTDICPVVAQEFIDAYRDLGPLASKVVFAAVNANPFYRSVHAVAAFTTEHQLSTIPDWHYFTGSLAALQSVWGDYHVTVTAPNRSNVIHTSAIYVIDPRGRERYEADADVEEPAVMHRSNGTAFIPGTEMPAWGRGIADLVRNLVG